MYKTEIRGPLILGNKTLSQISEEIISPMYQRPKMWWLIGMGVSSIMMLLGFWAIYTTISVGIGSWGVNNTVGWGYAIINFVWWIGIGHAGTAFSIFLLILRQEWRSSINRAAEAMTVVAVLSAALFPALHMGRIWDAFFIFPYPNTRGPLWVNYNSPLFWDFIAISAYLLISASFWFLGMIPDFATVRDTSKSKIKKAVYGFFAMGWRGSVGEWKRYEGLSFVLGGIAAVLVVSVHSIVSTDFAISVEPGWHTTLFPPYFVVGAIFSGFAMVMTLTVIIRKFYKLNDFITDRHLDNVAKILVFISLIMGTAYLSEIFIAWYSGNEYEMFTFFRNRITGEYTFQFWAMFICNALIPQLMWFKKIRSNISMLFIISLFINLGMWFERFNIVVTSLTKDYLPSAWTSYTPTFVEVSVFIGTLGIFGLGVLLFFRYIPMIAIHEVKMVNKFQMNKRRSKMKEEKVHILGVFADEIPLLDAFRELKKEEVEISDVFTPFPIHEILEHHGRKSRIVTASWFYGLFAALGVLSFLYYTAVIDWPLNYGGKPSSAFPSFIVVTIILTILSITILSLFTFSVRAKLWPNVGKTIYHEQATDDKFVILFEKEKIDVKKVTKILKDLGAIEIIEK